MTVRELMDELKKLPPEKKVVDYTDAEIEETLLSRIWFDDNTFESVVKLV